ncbi:MAG: hypothetical protein ABSC94_32835 [Polyangiaceae bacterium]|jgi:hypothetical protein
MDPARAKEEREEASRKSNPTRCAELHEELNARTDAGHGNREGVVNFKCAEDEEHDGAV